MQVVRSLLKIWHKQGHRVLLFTQGRQMMCILENFIQEEGYKYLKLDGTTSIAARQPLITEYNTNPEHFVFLLTTKVGGLGVNLTGADRVVIFDPDWNPATDTQARERAWRIGQERQVTIYRLVTAGTIEEKIYHRQIFKQFLTNKVLNDPRQRRFFKSNDLYELFTLKEGEERSTETSALFAGTGSEVKIKSKKARAPSPQPVIPKKIEFSREKIDRMKELAQKLSQQFTKKLEDKIQNKSDGKPSETLSGAKAGCSSSSQSYSNNATLKTDANNGSSLSGNDDSLKENVKLNFSFKESKSSDDRQQASSGSKKTEKSEKRHKGKHKEKKRHRVGVKFEGERVSHLVKCREYARMLKQGEEEETHNDENQDDYVLRKLFKKSGLQTALQHDSIMSGGGADIALVEREARHVAQEAVARLKESQRQCFNASAGVPTWTGTSGHVRAPRPMTEQRPKKKKKKPAEALGRAPDPDPEYDWITNEPEELISGADLIALWVKRNRLLKGPSPERPPSPYLSSEPYTDDEGQVFVNSVFVYLDENGRYDEPMEYGAMEQEVVEEEPDLFAPESPDVAAPASPPRPQVSVPSTRSIPITGEESDLLDEIRGFLAFGGAVDGQASTEELLQRFPNNDLSPSMAPLFKCMLQSVADFHRNFAGQGMWTLKPDMESSLLYNALRNGTANTMNQPVNNTESEVKTAASTSGFHVDRTLIQEIQHDEQDDELQDIGISLSVYHQDDLEQGILAQVDQALEQQEREQEKRRLDKQIKEVSDNIRTTEQKLSQDDVMSRVKRGETISIAKALNSRQERERRQQELANLRCKQKELTGKRAALDGDTQDQAGGSGILEKKAAEESEQERMIRLGEMTPFGTTLSAQQGKRETSAALTDFEKYFKSQASLNKSKLKSTSKSKSSTEPVPSTSKIAPVKPKKNSSLKFSVLIPKKRKHKDKLGTKSRKSTTSGLEPGPMLSETQTMNLDSDPDFVPDDFEDDDEDFVPKASTSKATPVRKAAKRKAHKKKKDSDSEWGTDDSDWESSGDEERIVKKRKKGQEMDDGEAETYSARVRMWEREEDLDRESMHQLDGGLGIPNLIWQKLYKYQQVGVQWMWELYQNGTGGILGDEMGLGKTIQVIAFLASLKESRFRDKYTGFRGLGASMIVCPTTVMHQWVKEMHTWWPPLRVAILHDSGSFGGSRNQLIREIAQSQGVLITSYEGLVKHQEALLRQRWHILVLDEGHKIRNPDAQATLAAKSVPTPHRIALTGSPMQNNLRELWSLFDFVYPSKLGTLPEFLATFANDESLPKDERYGYWEHSGKMQVVRSLLKIWHKQGHRVLLFTQGRQMMCILENFIQEEGYKYLKLDGTTSIAARQPLITEYNTNPEHFVFLLTTKVGGLGVNLTGADRVVIFDPDWNPATDTQARERAWRIGQERQVTIYRLVTAGTIEEKIYHRQIFKQFLTNKVLNDPRQRRFFKSNDLYELFTLKEGEERSTETSALFAGTGSEVKIKSKKARAPSPQPVIPKKIEFSREKIDRMKELAQKLSQQFTKKLEDKIQNKSDGKPSETLSGAKAGCSSSSQSYSNNATIKTDANNGSSLSGNDDSLKENVKLNFSFKESKSSDDRQQASSGSKKTEKSEKRHKGKHKEKKRHRVGVKFEGERVSHLVKCREYARMLKQGEEEETHNDENQDDYVLRKLFKKSGLQTALQHDSIMSGGGADIALVEREARHVAQEAVARLK
ncbi:hypothetical protein B566_EDAN002195, partial [Ephemera danica]